LEIQNAVMQDDDAFSTFDKVAQVLFTLLVEVTSEIIEDQHIIFRANVLLERQVLSLTATQPRSL